MGARSNQVAVSSVSILEIAIKRSFGKIELASGIDLARLPSACGLVDLPVSSEHAAHVEDLPRHHRDPFDRLLIAQAQVEAMKLVTMDRRMDLYDVERL